ncbi:Hsp33 family molecular chaperone HslO [Myxococcota bacterium]
MTPAAEQCTASGLMRETSDQILRAITQDSAFRVVVVSSAETVHGIIRAQRAKEQLAQTLGDLVTATILVRETMAPQHRVQGILRGGHHSGALIADSHPSGQVRGLVQLAPGLSTIDTGQGATLQMMRTLANGALHQGVAEAPAGGGLSEALMAYMQTSEQVTSVASVATCWAEPDRVVAGGFVVQLLPDASQEALRAMIERLDRFGSLPSQLVRSEFGAAFLLDKLLHGVAFSQVGVDSVRYQCWCDEIRMMSALASLKRDELVELAATSEPLEITCDYCGREYCFQPTGLQGLLEQS